MKNVIKDTRYTFAALSIVLMIANCARAEMVEAVQKKERISGTDGATSLALAEDRGILFHASFDDTRKAEIAGGSRIPSRLKHMQFKSRMDKGTYVDGKFGKAITGHGTVGWYEGLGNFSAERGTIAFFIRKKGLPYGFEPFLIRTIDAVYWFRYLRMKVHPGNRIFSTWFANECYKPFVAFPKANRKDDFTNDAWHHVAIVWDQAYGSTTYLDGEVYSSNWGKATWFSRGVDPDYIHLSNSDDVAYDELYIFDYPLNESQVKRLESENQPPSGKDSAIKDFDQAHQRNRKKELSWAEKSPISLELQLGMKSKTVNRIKQVLPVDARAVKKDSTSVFDGKLGSGWPPIYNYTFAKGNGLHVEMNQPFDYMRIDGAFWGNVYDKKSLLRDSTRSPLLSIKPSGFTYRHLFSGLQSPEWLSFFKKQTKTAPGEQFFPNRIVELGFFQTGESGLRDKDARKTYIGSLSRNLGGKLLGKELRGRFRSGDREAFACGIDAGKDVAPQRLQPLRYYHIIIPAPKIKQILDGFRISLRLHGKLNDSRMRIELRDPTLPGRCATTLDYMLKGDDADTVLNLEIDTIDRLVYPKSFIWVTICFERSVEVMTGGLNSSWIELFFNMNEKNIKEAVNQDVTFIKSRFREFSESRPWCRVKHPEKDLSAHNPQLRELFLPLSHLRETAPDDPRVQAIWNWTHKFLVNKETVIPQAVVGCENAPVWALLQRELLKGCRDIYYWWIENRQTPNGEFGDDWGDDTDLIQDFVKPALVCDPDHRFRNAVNLVADATFKLKLKNGINRNTTDYLHAYEEGINAQCAAAILNYGNPKYAERLMTSSRTVRDYLTSTDEKGRRRFKSYSYGADQIRDKGREGVDIPSNILFLHPAIVLGYQYHSPGAIRLLKEWADGWLDYYGEAAAAGKKKYPSATRLNGTVVRYDRKVRGYGVQDGYAAVYALTNDAAYRRPDIMQNTPSIPSIANFALIDMIDIKGKRGILVAQAANVDLSRPTIDRFGHLARRRLFKFELTGDESAAMQALEACIRNLRMMNMGYTWGEPINDRIWVPDHPGIVMALGEIPYERNQLWPRHYVSYEGLSDFAAWVREKSNDNLNIRLYNFTKKTENGEIVVWRLPLGQYSVILKKIDAEGKPLGIVSSTSLTLHKGAAIPLELPARTPCAVEIRLIKRSEDSFWKRGDLAIGPQDITRGSDGSMTVTVHNLGNSSMKNIVVRLVDAGGNSISEKKIESLNAPVNLSPCMTELIFPPTDAKKAVRIVLDPDNIIEELNERNNSLRILK